MKKYSIIAASLCLVSSLLVASEWNLTTEVKSVDVANKIDNQNDEILKKYTDNNSNVTVDTLPPFATMADVKVAVAKLINEMRNSKTDIANLNGRLDEKNTEIKYVAEKVNSIEVDVKQVKDLVINENNVSESGKTTLSGVDNKVNVLSLKLQETKEKPKKPKKQKKSHRIFAPAINCSCSVINADSVNLRTAPFKCADVVGYLQKGDKVTTISTKNKDWYKVTTNTGKTGWVSSKFIKNK